MRTTRPVDAARELVAVARSRPSTLGAGRLICIDGPAGSGKTTLAAAVSTLDHAAVVVHMDDLYDGWEGLPQVAEQLGGLLEPLARSEPGAYRRYDWVAERYAETVTVAPSELLVVEGVGSAALRFADLVTVLAWVEAPFDVRRQRGLERDGEALRDHWDRWQVAEQAMFAREATRSRADLVIETAP